MKDKKQLIIQDEFLTPEVIKQGLELLTIGVIPPKKSVVVVQNKKQP